MNLPRRPLLLSFLCGLGLQLFATLCRTISNFTLMQSSSTDILATGASSSDLATLLLVANCAGWLLVLFSDLLTGALYSYFFYQTDLPEGQEHLIGGAIAAATSHFLFSIVTQSISFIYASTAFADSNVYGSGSGLFPITFILSGMVSLCLSLAMGGMLGAAGASLTSGWIESKLRTAAE